MSEEFPQQTENKASTPEKVAEPEKTANQPAVASVEEQPVAKETSTEEGKSKPAKRARSNKSAKKKIAKKKQQDATLENNEKRASKQAEQTQKKSTTVKQADQRAEEGSDAPEEARKQGRNRRSRGNRGGGRQEAAEELKIKLDTKVVTKRAWKIFLSEINEEGLALIGDKDAREAAKRSLRVAEIYSREEAMQLAKFKQNAKKKKAEKSAEVKKVSNRVPVIPEKTNKPDSTTEEVDVKEEDVT